MNAKPVPTWHELQDSREVPVATVAILAVTIVVTLLQIAVPELRLHLWRNEDALRSGEFWRTRAHRSPELACSVPCRRGCCRLAHVLHYEPD